MIRRFFIGIISLALILLVDRFAQGAPVIGRFIPDMLLLAVLYAGLAYGGAAALHLAFWGGLLVGSTHLSLWGAESFQLVILGWIACICQDRLDETRPLVQMIFVGICSLAGAFLEFLIVIFSGQGSHASPGLHWTVFSIIVDMLWAPAFFHAMNWGDRLLKGRRTAW